MVKCSLKRVTDKTERSIGEDKSSFISGRDCMDHVLLMRQVYVKYVANLRDVFWAFMDLG